MRERERVASFLDKDHKKATFWKSDRCCEKKEGASESGRPPLEQIVKLVHKILHAPEEESMGLNLTTASHCIPNGPFLWHIKFCRMTLPPDSSPHERHEFSQN